MKNIDELLKEQETSGDFQALMNELSNSPTSEVDESFYHAVLSRLDQRAEFTTKRSLLFFSVSVAAFLILSFGGLVYSLGWESILEMRQTLFYGLITAGMIVVFQTADQILVKPKLKLS